jgi:transcriptional regulator with XRE-family HTH domain
MADILPFPRKDRPTPEPLWRDVLGEKLRAARTEQGQTLTDTATRAGISPQYLSEIERGRKEPSSEMIAAVAGALGTSLSELAGDVAREIRGATLLAA